MTTLDRHAHTSLPTPGHAPGRGPDQAPEQGSVAPAVTETVRVLAVAVLAGLALGVGDLWAMTHLPYPWANLANSSAVWAVAAFVLGSALRTDPARAAVGGAVLLVVAVESYYGFATAFDLSGLSTMWSAHARMWLVFGVVAGVAFGVAGAWTGGRVRWQRVVGVAAAAGVLLGEALHTQRRLDLLDGTFRTELAGTAVLLSVLALVVLLATARHPRVLLPAVVLTVPAALFCAEAFAATGIAG